MALVFLEVVIGLYNVITVTKNLYYVQGEEVDVTSFGIHIAYWAPELF